MRRTWLFARRNVQEMLRDPISYIFCLALPILMIVVMYYAFYSPQVFWFDLSYLVPGIAVFSLSFTMLNTALLVSRDKTLAFLTRLYTAPMRPVDFVLGYTLPGVLIGLFQLIACYLCGLVIALIQGKAYAAFGSVVLAIVSMIPEILLFVGIGFLFGTLFSMQSAPGLTSAVITVSGFLSGAWMPVETLGKTMQTVCLSLPFYPAVALGRTLFRAETPTFVNCWRYLLIMAGYTVVIYGASVLAFRHHSRSDRK